MAIRSAYVAGALMGLPDGETERMKRLYERIAEACKWAEVDAYAPHLHSDPEKNADMSPTEVRTVDNKQIFGRDLLILEATYPSHGGGGEAVEAKHADVPVWLIYRKGTKVSRYLRGNPAIQLELAYEDDDELIQALKLKLLRAETPIGDRIVNMR